MFPSSKSCNLSNRIVQSFIIIFNGQNIFIADIRSIIEHGRQQAYAADRQAAIATFWNVGRRIVEEEQKGESRAAYGTRLIHLLADRLKAEYGDGYGKRNAFFVSKQYLKVC